VLVDDDGVGTKIEQLSIELQIVAIIMDAIVMLVMFVIMALDPGLALAASTYHTHHTTSRSGIFITSLVILRIITHSGS
jgi:hypothetical protein